jgi:hypothetical protein
MRQIIGVIGGVLVAALVPAIFFGVDMLVFVVALLWVVLLGLPAFLLLKHLGCVRWWSAIVCGFVLGALPIAIVSWPYHPGRDSGFSAWDGHRMVAYVVHGLPTHAGWLKYVHDFCSMGLMGAASAIVFWCVWRLVVGPKHSFQRTRYARR